MLMQKTWWTGLAVICLQALGAAPAWQPPDFKRTGGEINQPQGVAVLRETAGNQGNEGTDFRLVFDAGSEEVKKINAVLAGPENSPATDFDFELVMQNPESSDGLVSAWIGVEFLGGTFGRESVLADKVPLKVMFADNTGWVKVNSDAVTLLRFRVVPAGGKKRINELALVISLRVDRDKTPESVAVRQTTLRELAKAPAVTGGRAVFVNCMPDRQLIALLAQNKIAAQTDSQAKDAGGIQFVAGNFAPRLDWAVKKELPILISLNQPQELRPDEANLLPVAAWSFKQPRLWRNGSTLLTPAGSGTQALAISRLWDLHTPGSKIENSLSRYNNILFDRPLNNTGWEVLLTTPAGMPELVSGRVGNSNVLVFGGDFFDPVLIASPGYPELLRLVLARLTAPVVAGASAELNQKLTVTAGRYQPDKLTVTVKNNAGEMVKTVLSYQVANWENEVLSRDVLAVDLKPGESKNYPLVERGSFKGNDQITEVGSEAIPYRRLRLAFLDRAGKVSGNEISAVVLTAPPLSLEVNSVSAADGFNAPRPEIDGSSDGDNGLVYVYRTGTKPEITVNAGNMLCNIAPLAIAKDLNTPDNPTVWGLNDLSLSGADVRRNGELQGGWAGKVAAGQTLSLVWAQPVTVGALALEAYGPYRLEERLNPRNVAFDADGRPILQVPQVTYTGSGSDCYRRAVWTLAGAESMSNLTLTVSNLDVKLKQKKHLNETNSSVRELVVRGFPAEVKPAGWSGTLEIAMCDLLRGSRQTVWSGPVTLAAYQSFAKTLTLPDRDAFGPVRYEFILKNGDKIAARCNYDVLFRPAEGRVIRDKDDEFELKPGLLCTPGWYQFDSFGRGMFDWTRGWGGPHDKIWAMTHGLTETGPGSIDQVDRMLATDTRASHYITPWRYLPDGSYGWDLTMDKLLEQMTSGREKGKKSVHVTGSDRWNGIPVNNSFGWDYFVRFDQYLRKTTGKGLSGKSRRELADEILNNHYRTFQNWMLADYAVKVQQTQDEFAAKGIKFTFETHGSFPLAGGETGKALGKTHSGVGTDLFWELINQDLYWSLGSRFAVVAANPDLQSGLYKQWGWVNSEANPTWFANNASVEPARRQWYNTYFMGRVDSAGEFLPYHVYGYSLQGGVSTKFYKHDIQNYSRTFALTRYLRNEQAAGFGLAVSWAAFDAKVGNSGRKLGFGIYASGAESEQLEYRFAKLFEKLVKAGLPVGFVTSETGLKNWQRGNPLLILDAGDWSEEDLRTLERLNTKYQAPLIGFGGAAKADGFWLKGSKKIELDGQTAVYLRNERSAPVIYFMQDSVALRGESMTAVADFIMAQTKYGIRSSARLAISPFICYNRLFLALGNQGDLASQVTLELDPAVFLDTLRGAKLRVIDLDQNVELPTQSGGDGKISFRFPMSGTDGKMIMISKGE